MAISVRAARRARGLHTQLSLLETQLTSLHNRELGLAERLARPSASTADSAAAAYAPPSLTSDGLVLVMDEAGSRPTSLALPQRVANAAPPSALMSIALLPAHLAGVARLITSSAAMCDAAVRAIFEAASQLEELGSARVEVEALVHYVRGSTARDRVLPLAHIADPTLRTGIGARRAACGLLAQGSALRSALWAAAVEATVDVSTFAEVGARILSNVSQRFAPPSSNVRVNRHGSISIGRHAAPPSAAAAAAAAEAAAAAAAREHAAAAEAAAKRVDRERAVAATRARAAAQERVDRAVAKADRDAALAQQLHDERFAAAVAAAAEVEAKQADHNETAAARDRAAPRPNVRVNRHGSISIRSLAGVGAATKSVVSPRARQAPVASYSTDLSAPPNAVEGRAWSEMTDARMTALTDEAVMELDATLAAARTATGLRGSSTDEQHSDSDSARRGTFFGTYSPERAAALRQSGPTNLATIFAGGSGGVGESQPEARRAASGSAKTSPARRSRSRSPAHRTGRGSGAGSPLEARPAWGEAQRRTSSPKQPASSPRQPQPSTSPIAAAAAAALPQPQPQVRVNRHGSISISSGSLKGSGAPLDLTRAQIAAFGFDSPPKQQLAPEPEPKASKVKKSKQNGKTRGKRSVAKGRRGRKKKSRAASAGAPPPPPPPSTPPPSAQAAQPEDSSSSSRRGTYYGTYSPERATTLRRSGRTNSTFTTASAAAGATVSRSSNGKVAKNAQASKRVSVASSRLVLSRQGARQRSIGMHLKLRRSGRKAPRAAPKVASKVALKAAPRAASVEAEYVATALAPPPPPAPKPTTSSPPPAARARSNVRVSRHGSITITPPAAAVAAAAAAGAAARVSAASIAVPVLSPSNTHLPSASQSSTATIFSGLTSIVEATSSKFSFQSLMQAAPKLHHGSGRLASEVASARGRTSPKQTLPEQQQRSRLRTRRVDGSVRSTFGSGRGASSPVVTKRRGAGKNKYSSSSGSNARAGLRSTTGGRPSQRKIVHLEPKR